LEIIVSIAIVAVVIIAIWVVGRAIGPPDPATISDSMLELQLKTHRDWTSKYMFLPISQQTPSLKGMYETKKKYIKRAEIEQLFRNIVRGVYQGHKPFQPIFERAAELEKAGMAREPALRKALDEWEEKSAVWKEKSVVMQEPYNE
jgi:hypothetical protein